MGGRVVQLEQGERLVVESNDLDGWMARFAGFPLVQLIDLDAAMGRGDNTEVVRYVCGRLSCQVGGGIRSVERARRTLDMGARRVIVGSALFGAAGVNDETARAFAAAIDRDALVAAIDSRGGRVVIHGWKTQLGVTPEDAARSLEPFVGTFLYTHVDNEGLLAGLNRDAVLSLRRATSRRLIAAGGIKSREEIDWLDGLGVDAVVGMALYKGIIPTTGAQSPPRSSPRGSGRSR
jgi:phosphoribosylformimino-5-aminoimidazole carboxamide ribotide isomerase